MGRKERKAGKVKEKRSKKLIHDLLASIVSDVASLQEFLAFDISQVTFEASLVFQCTAASRTLQI